MKEIGLVGLYVLVFASQIAFGQEYVVDYPGIVQASPSDTILAESPNGNLASSFAQANSTVHPSESAEMGAPSESKALSEKDVQAIIAKYLEDKDAIAEDSLTPQEKREKELTMTARWNDGLEFSTKNKAFRSHIGGRYQFDTSWFGAPQNVNNNINVPYTDGIDFRRARIRMDGTLYEVHEYALEFDFVNSVRVRNQPGVTNFFDETVTAPTDLWWQIKEMPAVGNVRFGYQKEQIGFEHIVSSRFQPFMERSYNQDTFYGGLFNGFQPGVAIFNHYDNESGVWNLGLFKPTNSVFPSATGDGDYAVSGRLTRLLLYENEGERLIHVGVSGRQASAVTAVGVPGRAVTYRTRDAVRAGLSQNWSVPAGISLYGDDTQMANAELVIVNGPWTWQSEYLVNGLQDASTSLGDPTRNVTYHGGYAQLLVFITGEHDHYSKRNGAFERVKPNCNFFKPGRCGEINGMGAWQIGFRYNHLDLNDRGLNGGILDSYVAGVNWFWNPNMKWQFNFSATDRDVSEVTGRTAGSGVVHAYGTRVAMDF